MLVISIVVVVFVMLTILERVFSSTSFYAENAEPWRRKWPAISDDEFVARCPIGTNREKALKVRRIISQQLGIAYEHIHPEQRFVEDLDCC